MRSDVLLRATHPLALHGLELDVVDTARQAAFWQVALGGVIHHDEQWRISPGIRAVCARDPAVSARHGTGIRRRPRAHAAVHQGHAGLDRRGRQVGVEREMRPPGLVDEQRDAPLVADPAIDRTSAPVPYSAYRKDSLAQELSEQAPAVVDTGWLPLPVRYGRGAGHDDHGAERADSRGGEQQPDQCAVAR
jgi:hypothetical protein